MFKSKRLDFITVLTLIIVMAVASILFNQAKSKPEKMCMLEVDGECVAWSKSKYLLKNGSNLIDYRCPMGLDLCIISGTEPRVEYYLFARRENSSIIKGGLYKPGFLNIIRNETIE